jgi:hypothetical protein
MVRKIIKEGLKAGVKKIGRGTRAGKSKIDAPKDLKAAKAKTGTKSTKTVKRSEAPIQSERSKIAKANTKAANQRAKTAGKTVGKTAGVGATRNTTNRVLPVGSKRAIGTAGVASAAAIGTLNKKGSSAPAKVTFADAFRKARAKGEGTKFTHNGKSYVAVTKTDLKKKGYDDNELAAYNKRGGKARGPLNRLGQKAKKVLLGKDKKFGGDKGAIDFIRKPKKKAGGGMMKSKGMKVGGMMKSKGMARGGAMKTKGYARGGAVKSKATGAAKRGFGKAYMKGKR